MECLKINCSLPPASMSTEYLSKERTLPEILTRLSNHTVTGCCVCCATAKNDSWMLADDIGKKSNSLPHKIGKFDPSVQYIIGLRLIGVSYGSPPATLFLRSRRGRKLYARG